MNQVNELGDILDLIGLQVANEMPSDSLITKVGPLGEEFLNVVLTDVKKPAAGSLPNGVDLERL